MNSCSQLASKLALLLIRAYQFSVGLVLPPACRYHPSCSRYFQDALVLHGFGRGFILGMKRLLKCHPWGGAGYDPVPSKSVKNAEIE